jgi:pyruvate dehydrogenase E2 component (dihydrolipoamide acetyltransferase)
MAEVKEVAVPDIGDFEDVPVIEVLVAEGDAIDEEQPLVTLESDKASMDVPAPFAGTVAELKVSEGDKVSEGTIILTVTVNGDAPSGGDEGGGDDDGEEASEDPEGGGDEAADTEAGAGDSGGPSDAAKPEAASAVVDAEAEGAGAGGAEAPSTEGKVRSDRTDGGPVYASPAVRRAARQRDIDLATIEGTGRGGRITLEDLDRGPSKQAPAKEGAGAPAGAEGDGGLGLAPWPKVDFEKFGEVERVALSRIKKLSGPNLARNWVRIPHVTHHDEADITDLEAFRKQLNKEQQDVKVTMVAILVKAVVASLKAFPEVNSSLDGDELVLRKYYNIGFAADTPNGLVVPVIKGADAKGMLDIAAELGELSGKARAGKLMPGDMAGSTFTISSLGGIGGTGFTPIVNAPEVAILGVTRSAMKPVWDGGQFVPRLMVPLSLSYDHRVVDGALGARFVAHLVGVLQDMRRVLL